VPSFPTLLRSLPGTNSSQDWTGHHPVRGSDSSPPEDAETLKIIV